MNEANQIAIVFLALLPVPLMMSLAGWVPALLDYLEGKTDG